MAHPDRTHIHFSDADMDLLRTIAGGYIAFRRYQEAESILQLALVLKPDAEDAADMLARLRRKQNKNTTSSTSLAKSFFKQ